MAIEPVQRGDIDSWDAGGLRVAVDDADVPDGILDSFSSDRNRLIVDIAHAGGRNQSLNLSFERIDETGPGVVIQIAGDLVENGLQQTEDGLELRI